MVEVVVPPGNNDSAGGVTSGHTMEVHMVKQMVLSPMLTGLKLM